MLAHYSTGMNCKSPIRVALIGAGKFGSMFLSQEPSMPDLEVVSIADLNPDRAREACLRVGWDEARISQLHFLDDGEVLSTEPDIDVVIEATGDPVAAIRLSLIHISEPTRPY